MMPRVLKILLFEESRKTAFACWVFFCATMLLVFELIEPLHWVEAVGICSALVSGSAVWEKYLERKNGAPAPVPEDR